MSGGAPAPLAHRERLAWLRLIRTDNIGPVTFRELIRHFGSASAAIDAVPGLARRGGQRIRIASEADAERELAAVAALGGHMIALSEPDYPPALRSIADPPPMISVNGARACLTRPAAAVVGSRNASIAGRKLAMQVAQALGAAGFVVASGLARGIDAAVHEAALATGTIAVLAGGLDRPYPPENTGLAERIVAAGGAHVTEMPMGREPRGRDFPRRNRIISGLSLAVVVVEAAERSGSLITARRAADQGRLVFAVPGSPLDPRSAGTNRLIRDGATIVTATGDVVAEIAPMLARLPAATLALEEAGPEAPVEATDSERERVIAALGQAPVAVDDIVRFAGLSPAVVHLVLLELDLSGRIERVPGGRVQRVG